MSIFLESPWPATLLCVAIQIILGVVFLRTGRGLVLVAMTAMLALAGGLLVLERAIVTDTEQVEDTLHGIAEDLTAHDYERVFAAFSPQFPRMNEIRSRLKGVTINSASIANDLDVRISMLSSPPTATAFFTGRINARDTRGEIPYENFFRKFRVKLERRDNRWLITDVQEAAPGGRER